MGSTDLPEAATDANMGPALSPGAVDRRLKTACERCKKRKTKCSGEYPCRYCQSNGVECVYTRKRKRISVFDTELDAYKMRIATLEAQLADAYARGAPPETGRKSPQMGGIKVESRTPDPTPRLDLSVWLGLPSPELVCMNLKTFASNKLGQRLPHKTGDVTILPDFSNLYEESSYDHMLGEARMEAFTKDLSLIASTLQDLTLAEADQLLDHVVLFLNSGYLTLDPVDGRKRIRSYFSAETGKFDVRLIDNSKNDYFFLTFLVLMALGEVYSPNATILTTADSRHVYFDTVPGAKYFNVVVRYMPNVFQLIYFSKENTADTIQVMEFACLLALYLRCLDKKNLSALFTLNALQLGVSMNLHKESAGSENFTFSRVMWATYSLNRFFSVRTGQALLLDPKEITRTYPTRNIPNYDTKTENTSYPIQNKYEFTNSDSIEFFIKLAKISDRISSELYCMKMPFDNKAYLSSTLKILDSLKDWAHTVPDYLRLRVQSHNKYNHEHQRLTYSLHLNYLHHIYLTCIPIMLNFAKVKIFAYDLGQQNTHNLSNEEFDLQTLPRNIHTLLESCIGSSQLTINIFMTIYKENLLRVFGFTDIDFLFSSVLVFTICLILRIKQVPSEGYLFEDYLEVSINLIYEMKMKGNLVAKGKLEQICDLLLSLHDLFIGLGHAVIYYKLQKYATKPAPKMEPMPEEHKVPPENPQAVHHHQPVYGAPPAVREYGINQLLDEFQIDRDVVDVSFLTDHAFAGLHPLPEGNYQQVPQNYGKVPQTGYSRELFTVTDDDLLFMNQIALDMRNEGGYTV